MAQRENRIETWLSQERGHARRFCGRKWGKGVLRTPLAFGDGLL
jgi:hypothetical protein